MKNASKKRNNSNARKHGAYAKIQPPMSNDPKFEKLHEKLSEHIRPQGPLQIAMVHDLAASMFQKRKFDKWFAREFRTVLDNIDIKGRLQNHVQLLDDQNRQIAELEHAFDEKAIKLATSAISAAGKKLDRLLTKIAEHDKIRNAALAPLLASRDRNRAELEDPPLHRRLERLQKCDAAMGAAIEKRLRRLAMAKTFDDLHGPKIVDQRLLLAPHSIADDAEEKLNPSSNNNRRRDRDMVDLNQNEQPLRILPSGIPTPPTDKEELRLDLVTSSTQTHHPDDRPPRIELINPLSP